ncbi:hypothetical protein Tco_1452372, partial [Tanacetum coccineum]
AEGCVSVWATNSNDNKKEQQQVSIRKGFLVEVYFKASMLKDNKEEEGVGCYLEVNYRIYEGFFFL